MGAWTVLWMVAYVVAALAFFVTAAIITVIGTRDLRDLLSKSNRKD